jgi:hypothetical protein
MNTVKDIWSDAGVPSSTERFINLICNVAREVMIKDKEMLMAMRLVSTSFLKLDYGRLWLKVDRDGEHEARSRSLHLFHEA